MLRMIGSGIKPEGKDNGGDLYWLLELDVDNNPSSCLAIPNTGFYIARHEPRLRPLNPRLFEGVSLRRFARGAAMRQNYAPANPAFWMDPF